MLKVKRLTESAKIPLKKNEEDAGFDVFSDEDVVIPSQERASIKTGIALSLTPLKSDMFTSYLRVAPRSGLAVKNGINVFAGVVDLGYRGEIIVCLFNASKTEVEIKKGDRIAQIIPTIIQKTSIIEVETLDETERGDKGFGSSGR